MSYCPECAKLLRENARLTQGMDNWEQSWETAVLEKYQVMQERDALATRCRELEALCIEIRKSVSVFPLPSRLCRALDARIKGTPE